MVPVRIGAVSGAPCPSPCTASFEFEKFGRVLMKTLRFPPFPPRPYSSGLLRHITSGAVAAAGHPMQIFRFLPR